MSEPAPEPSAAAEHAAAPEQPAPAATAAAAAAAAAADPRLRGALALALLHVKRRREADAAEAEARVQRLRAEGDGFRAAAAALAGALLRLGECEASGGALALLQCLWDAEGGAGGGGAGGAEGVPAAALAAALDECAAAAAAAAAAGGAPAAGLDPAQRRRIASLQALLRGAALLRTARDLRAGGRPDAWALLGRGPPHDLVARFVLETLGRSPPSPLQRHFASEAAALLAGLWQDVRAEPAAAADASACVQRVAGALCASLSAVSHFDDPAASAAAAGMEEEAEEEPVTAASAVPLLRAMAAHPCLGQHVILAAAEAVRECAERLGAAAAEGGWPAAAAGGAVFLASERLFDLLELCTQALPSWLQAAGSSLLCGGGPPRTSCLGAALSSLLAARRATQARPLSARFPLFAAACEAALSGAAAALQAAGVSPAVSPAVGAAARELCVLLRDGLMAAA